LKTRSPALVPTRTLWSAAKAAPVMAEAAKMVEKCIMIGLLEKETSSFLVIKIMWEETKVVLVCNW
jgi:hypothetical protein